MCICHLFIDTNKNTTQLSPEGSNKKDSEKEVGVDEKPTEATESKKPEYLFISTSPRTSPTPGCNSDQGNRNKRITATSKGSAKLKGPVKAFEAKKINQGDKDTKLAQTKPSTMGGGKVVSGSHSEQKRAMKDHGARGNTPEPKTPRSDQSVRGHIPQPEKRPGQSVRGNTPEPEKGRLGRGIKSHTPELQKSRPGQRVRGHTPEPQKKPGQGVRGHTPEPQKGRPGHGIRGHTPEPQKGRPGQGVRGHTPEGNRVGHGIRNQARTTPRTDPSKRTTTLQDFKVEILVSNASKNLNKDFKRPDDTQGLSNGAAESSQHKLNGEDPGGTGKTGPHPQALPADSGVSAAQGDRTVLHVKLSRFKCLCACLVKLQHVYSAANASLVHGYSDS